MKIAWMYSGKDKDSRTTVMAIEFAEWLIEQKPTEKIMVSKNFIRNLTTEEMYYKWLRHLDKVREAHKKRHTLKTAK